MLKLVLGIILWRNCDLVINSEKICGIGLFIDSKSIRIYVKKTYHIILDKSLEIRHTKESQVFSERTTKSMESIQ